MKVKVSCWIVHVCTSQQPGTPGGAWTSEEADIVRRKVSGRKPSALLIFWSPQGVGAAEPEELQLETSERSFCKGRHILRMAGHTHEFIFWSAKTPKTGVFCWWWQFLYYIIYHISVFIIYYIPLIYHILLASAQAGKSRRPMTSRLVRLRHQLYFASNHKKWTNNL